MPANAITSSTIIDRRRPSLAISWPYRCTCAPSATTPSARFSAAERITLSGVRSSCETPATNSSRSCASRCARRDATSTTPMPAARISSMPRLAARFHRRVRATASSSDPSRWTSARRHTARRPSGAPMTIASLRAGSGGAAASRGSTVIWMRPPSGGGSPPGGAAAAPSPFGRVSMKREKSSILSRSRSTVASGREKSAVAVSRGQVNSACSSATRVTRRRKANRSSTGKCSAAIAGSSVCARYAVSSRARMATTSCSGSSGAAAGLRPRPPGAAAGASPSPTRFRRNQGRPTTSAGPTGSIGGPNLKRRPPNPPSRSRARSRSANRSRRCCSSGGRGASTSVVASRSKRKVEGAAWAAPGPASAERTT